MQYEEIIPALEHIQQYYPYKEVERELVVPNPTGEDTVIKLKDKQYAMTLVGGDQLTVARIRGSQRIRHK